MRRTERNVLSVAAACGMSRVAKMSRESREPGGG